MTLLRQAFGMAALAFGFIVLMGFGAIAGIAMARAVEVGAEWMRLI